MKIIDCIQGTPEWHKARLGIPTASEFDKILTPGGKESMQADKYANRLIAEIILGQPVEDWKGNMWTDRGKVLEEEAANYYAMNQGVELETVGFCTDDDHTIGCSPDRLIGKLGMAEFKCPSPQVHISYMLNPMILRADYFAQCQGQMLVTDRSWDDLVSYYPGLPTVILRIERDVKYLTLLRRALGEFRMLLDEKRAKMVELGYMDAA